MHQNSIPALLVLLVFPSATSAQTLPPGEVNVFN